VNVPIWFQRLEGAALFIAATLIYFNDDLGWAIYILLLFTFDASMVGYALNPRIGAILYNAVHSLIGPALLTPFYLWSSEPWLLGLICLWVAHIGLDRALGYGLKLTSGFRHTHLGEIGKR
jgi:hypothetical protein